MQEEESRVSNPQGEMRLLRGGRGTEVVVDVALGGSRVALFPSFLCLSLYRVDSFRRKPELERRSRARRREDQVLSPRRLSKGG